MARAASAFCGRSSLRSAHLRRTRSRLLRMRSAPWLVRSPSTLWSTCRRATYARCTRCWHCSRLWVRSCSISSRDPLPSKCWACVWMGSKRLPSWPKTGCAPWHRRREIVSESFAVDVENVSKSFGGVKALDGVTLRVKQGEIYGLLGPNGAGKTTLIRAIVGLIAPSGGTVTVLGKRIPNLDVLREVGYMTQQAALYPGLSVEENVLFFAAINGAEGGVDDALKLVELDQRRKSVVATLSGGMRQRCSLACALVHKPQLLLLDEPTVGVDPQLRVQFWEEFRRMAAAGTTIIVSSHVMDEAERCQRLGLVQYGKLLAEGSPDEVRAQAGTPNLEEAFLRLAGRAES